jgi:hypothetical protein
LGLFVVTLAIAIRLAISPKNTRDAAFAGQ